jgi:hypothetical protein
MSAIATDRHQWLDQQSWSRENATVFNWRSKSDAELAADEKVQEAARVLVAAKQAADAAVADAQRQADEITTAARREADVIRAAARADASGTGSTGMQQQVPDWLNKPQVADWLRQPDEPPR